MELTRNKFPEKRVLSMKEKIENCREWNEFYYDLADSIWNRKFTRYHVVFDIDSAGLAGQACYQKKLLRYNRLIMDTNFERFVEQTVPHEIAHVINYELGGRGHDRNWRTVMERLGVKRVTRCHNYDCSAAQKAKGYSTWHCGCSEHSLSKVINDRMVRGQKRRCPRCRTVLEWGPLVKEEGTKTFSKVDMILAKYKRR